MSRNGYTHCDCRDCFEITIGSEGDEHVLCLECEEAGCDAEGESECNVARDDHECDGDCNHGGKY